MTEPARIGILGGTFDPFHVGHLALAHAASTALHLDRVHVVASRVPPHRPAPGASSYHRFAMVALGVAGEPLLVADDIEMADRGPSFTTTTLRKFHDRGWTPSQIFFIVGADAFAEIATWRDYPSVLDGANFVVIARPGLLASALIERRLPALASRVQHPTHLTHLTHPTHPSVFLLDVPTPDVSGTVIRERAAAGLALDAMVPPLVAAHIKTHHLYEASAGQFGSVKGPQSAAHELHEQESI